jgi:hypothetical protein
MERKNLRTGGRFTGFLCTFGRPVLWRDLKMGCVTGASSLRVRDGSQQRAMTAH